MGKIVGEKQIKENALDNFYENIKKSWTYKRLTKEERERLEITLFSPVVVNNLKGTYGQRYRMLLAIYHSFLMALDYKPIGWREEEKDLPLF